MREVQEIAQRISHADIEKMAEELVQLRHRKGKLFIIGLGGSMANAIHMAADLRKLCYIKADAFDNLAELTARANDEGLETIFRDWISCDPNDALFVLSVGGGTETVSKSIVVAIAEAKAYGMQVLGIVGPDGGYTAARNDPKDIVIKIPAPAGRITPHTEAFQAVVWHCLVSHPLLQKNKTVW